jgi:hypothetical protein
MIPFRRPLHWLALIAVTVFTGVSCGAVQVSAVKNAAVGTVGARLIRIVSDAGVLKIDGRPGETSATVRAVAIASGKRVLSGIKLVATREGDVVTIRPQMPHRNFFSWGRSFFAAMDMSITVPAGVPIEITDGSGDIVARGVGPLKISDGSGGIDVRGTSGDLEIADGSGDVTVNGVEGNVKITDGSGGMSVANVTGDLNIPDDGSGTLRAERIGGSVRVSDKGSGEMNVAHIGSDLVVGEKGSGLIRYDDVRGKVAVPQRR